MELSELKFVVNTKQLEDAATKIKELAVEVSKLNKPVTDAALKSEKLAQAQAKTARETAKLEEANTKTAIAAERLTKAQKANTTAANAGNAIAERQIEILKFQTEGYSKGNAATLAAAKAAGAYDDVLQQLGVTLKDQRILMGTQPFDNSEGLMQKLENQTRISTEVNNLFNRSLGLTEKQMIDLAREHERLIKKYELEGKSLSGVAAEYDELIRKSVMLTQTNDARTNSMKAQIKAQNDTAKANEYIAKELERVNRLTESNGDITSATNNRLIRFEKELKASGITAAEVTTRLDAYRTSLLATQKAAGNRQVDYLSRALGPQITDIFVGLATGQAPLTILLQQGGQLRDQFALAGVAGSEMGKMLVQASKAMVSSVKDIGLAVGQLITGAVAGTGKVVTDFAMQVSGAGFLIDSFRKKIAALGGENSLAIKTFDALGKAFTVFAGLTLFTVIASLAALAKGLYDVIKQEDALTTQLVLTGASLGLNVTTANQYAQSLNAVGVSTSSALKGIAAMAKEGGFLANEITMVVTAANNLKFAGVAIEDTVKQFVKLKEKPVEALIEIAKNTGLIKPEIIALISELEQQGRTSEAAAIAMKAYADITLQQKDRLKDELSDFAVFMKTLGSSIADFFDDTFRALWRKSDPSTVIEEQIKAVDDLLNNRAGLAGSVISVTGLGSESLKKQKEALVEQLMILDQQKVSEISANNDRIRTAKILETVNKQRQDVLSNDEKRNREVRKAEKEHAVLINKGLMTQIESEKILNNIRDKYKDPAKPKEKTALDFYESTLLSITKLTNTSVVSQYELNKAQLKMLEVIDDPRFQKQPLIKQQEILQRLANASVILDEAEALEELRKQNIKVTEEYIKQQQVKDELGIAAFDNSVALNKAVKEESDELIFQATLIGKTDEQRKKAIKTRQSELTLAKELRDIEDLKELGFGVTKESLREAANQRFLERAKNINTEIAIDAATKTLEEYNKIADGITDSIVTALIEGGEAGGKKLRSIIEAELKRPITVFVRAIVDSLTGGAGSAAGSAGGNLLSSMGGSLISSTLGSITVGGGSLAAAGSAFGTGFMTTLQGGSIAEAAGIYSAAGMTGVSGGLSAGAAVAGAIPQIAAALAVANALGLFRSTKQVGGGISGTLGGSVDQYGTMRKSGTLFNGPSYFRQNQGTFAGNDLLQTSFQQLKDSTKAMADTLKLSSAGVEDFTKTIDISFDGLTNTQIEEKIASTLKSVNDELAALVLGAGATADQLNTLYNNVMQQRYDLETQLLELQGKTLELRERERAKIYDVNKEMFDQIKALEDQKVANEQAAAAMEKLTSVTTTIVDEINRLRGVSTSSSGLEAQFAILTAQARSGDLAALAQLPDVTKGLEQIAASSAVNATDIIVARARLAQSLQDTLGYFPSGTSLSTSSTSVSASNALSSGLTVSSGTSVNSASSNQELLAALVTEVQGLRAEVRADVSHNAKTAKILERVNQDGESLSITTLV